MKAWGKMKLRYGRVHTLVCAWTQFNEYVNSISIKYCIPSTIRHVSKEVWYSLDYKTRA